VLCIGKYGEMLIDHLDKVDGEEVLIVNVFQSFSISCWTTCFALVHKRRLDEADCLPSGT
jgi:hypothetical protein